LHNDFNIIIEIFHKCSLIISTGDVNNDGKTHNDFNNIIENL